MPRVGHRPDRPQPVRTLSPGRPLFRESSQPLLARPCPPPNLLGRTFGPEDDASLLDHGIGFTDVVKRPTPQASGLTAEDYRRDAPVLREKILRYAPRIACFHGLTAYRAYLRHAEGVTNPGNIELGRQDLAIGASYVFVLPNPSPANARYSLDDLAAWYVELNRWRVELNQ